MVGKTLLLFAAAAAFVAADETGGLTKADADLLRNKLAAAEAALDAQLRPVERRSENNGPSVSAVAGDIVQSANAGKKAVIKIGGEESFTFAASDSYAPEDGGAPHVIQTIGGGSLKVISSLAMSAMRFFFCSCSLPAGK
jgi:hypothetical protein